MNRTVTINIENPIYGKLPHDLIEINWNKKRVKMNLFLSFFSVITDYECNCTLWTTRRNRDFNLIIGGGWVNGTEYLDTIQYGTKLQNTYNNYVNPFYIFDLLNESGKQFFIEYYKNEIEALLSKQESLVFQAERKLKEQQDIFSNYKKEIENLWNEQ